MCVKVIMQVLFAVHEFFKKKNNALVSDLKKSRTVYIISVTKRGEAYEENSISICNYCLGCI